MTTLTWTNMLGVQMDTPEAGIRNAIVNLRTSGRWDEYKWTPGQEGQIPGGCGWMSEEMTLRYGWQEDGGCYVTAEGHISHYWNVLPDGRIIDTTADQFREADVPEDGIRITTGDDSRYDSTCMLPMLHEIG